MIQVMLHNSVKRWIVPHNPTGPPIQNKFLRSNGESLTDKLKAYQIWIQRVLKDTPYIFVNYDDDALFENFQAQLEGRTDKRHKIFILSLATDHEWIDEEAIRLNRHANPNMM